MPYDTAHHRRRSIRLPGYDYSQPGAYFVTLCVQHRLCLFGEVEDGLMVLSESGRIVQSVWDDLPRHYPNIRLDAFVVMPNHIHGIISIVDTSAPDANRHRRGLINQTPTPDDRWISMRTEGDPLGKIVRAFKARGTRRIRLNGCPEFAWQRNYFERVLRNEHELDLARQYIRDNPLRWHLDRMHPTHQSW